MQLIIPAGVNVLEYVRQKGLFLPAYCSGAGECGKCRVKLIAGSLDITPEDRRLLQETQLSQGLRLACKAFTKSPVRVELPDTPSQYDTPDKYWETPDPAHTFGIAADIGTTTIALSLVDITDKRPVRTVTVTNSAAAYGADVITRLGSALSGKGSEIRKAMQHDLLTALQKLEAPSLNIIKMTVAANTAMYHLLLGFDCLGLCKAPFAPATLGGETLPLYELLGGECALPDIPVTLVKGISAFVGGDISSGLASLPESGKTLLFLDLGTNGEAALVADDKLFCASAAAGPALEGGELSCGCGGVRGAVCRVYDKDGALAFDTIDNAPPVGICGSGAIDALAFCLDKGYIDKQGTFLDSFADTGLALAENISLTGQDIRELQLAKAAIRACLDTLLVSADKTYADIDSLIIAGGFGHFLDIDSACTVGLIPKELKPKTHSLGNTSLKGAQQSLYDDSFFSRLSVLCSKAATLPLSDDEGFKERFIENINFNT